MSSDQQNACGETGGATRLDLHVNLASIRPAPPVPDQPVAVLLQWRIVRLFNGVCVLVGCLEGGPALRITTPIVRFEGRRVWTKSGRRYELQFDPATDEETLALLCERLTTSSHFDYIDVTEQFLAGTLKIDPC
jgi:hypothetical protein